MFGVPDMGCEALWIPNLYNFLKNISFGCFNFEFVSEVRKRLRLEFILKSHLDHFSFFFLPG